MDNQVDLHLMNVQLIGRSIDHFSFSRSCDFIHENKSFEFEEILERGSSRDYM